MKFGTLVRLKDLSQVKEQFDALKKEGLEVCQLVYKPEKYIKEDAEIIANASKSAGIEICGFFAGYRDNNCFWDGYHDYNVAGINNLTFGKERIEYVKSAIEFASLIGIKQVIIHAGYVTNNPFSQEFTLMVSLLKKLCAFAKGFGVDILLETGQESPIALKRLIVMSGADNLFINFDTANVIMYGYGNPVDAIYTFGEYIRNTHAKDGLPPKEIDKTGVETVIGEGYVDFERVLKDLKKTGYDDYIVVEREISGEQQKVDVLKAIEKLKTIWNSLD